MHNLFGGISVGKFMSAQNTHTDRQMYECRQFIECGKTGRQILEEKRREVGGRV